MPRRKHPDVEMIRQVASHHRAELLARSCQLADDPRFVSGAAWAVRALDRVLLACGGVTDPGQLGLDQHLGDPIVEPEPVGLFEVGE